MEWYHIKIKWWFGDTELYYTHCVIPAKSYGEALNEVLKDYGHEEIEEIKMWQDENYDMHGFTLDEGEEGDERKEAIKQKENEQKPTTTKTIRDV